MYINCYSVSKNVKITFAIYAYRSKWCTCTYSVCLRLYMDNIYYVGTFGPPVSCCQSTKFPIITIMKRNKNPLPFQKRDSISSEKSLDETHELLYPAMSQLEVSSNCLMALGSEIRLLSQLAELKVSNNRLKEVGPGLVRMSGEIKIGIF